ncbi:hypothetical protein KL933_002819 [Ogataea haglerorum]|uniref:Uncharacterized protein n=1 Tax=Ogataea haglerorum TaxID=1937702 RepID=A0AAN6D6Q5_9ASCO|nr:hypothetical protein KL915_000401 [Ogataea haglerorum]KAG7727110.1 hypothetical protein KL933_002819 [Ogataea haglerorum]KAG7741908.1 hypothetical protein KL923_001163 [Ogataea haglerorum]KAG7760870.1 hypothetical protein KL947_000841 [Ogataea haglerorum]KAG7771464.1 hypothetical protein KL931_001162 [Ogataea haglerorum]
MLRLADIGWAPYGEGRCAGPLTLAADEVWASCLVWCSLAAVGVTAEWGQGCAATSSGGGPDLIWPCWRFRVISFLAFVSYSTSIVQVTCLAI